jgi:hypothetical protein
LEEEEMEREIVKDDRKLAASLGISAADSLLSEFQVQLLSAQSSLAAVTDTTNVLNQLMMDKRADMRRQQQLSLQRQQLALRRDAEAKQKAIAARVASMVVANSNHDNKTASDDAKRELDAANAALVELKQKQLVYLCHSFPQFFNSKISFV